MIRQLDSAKLALTKLRTRRIRLGITVFISALIFSGLTAASFISNGIFHSIESFSEEGFGSRYIMQASAVSSQSGDLFQNKTVLNRAEKIQKNLTARKKVEAKRLGVNYDPLSDTPAIDEYEGPNGKERSLNPTSSAGMQAIKEYSAKHPMPGQKELKKIGNGYNAVGFYKSISLSQGGLDGSSLAVLKKGKEEYKSSGEQNFNPFQAGTDSFTSSWNLMSTELLKPFLLPGQSAELRKDKTLPVVAPYTAVEQLLGLEPLPANAKTPEKLARIKEVRANAADLSFEVCYRNQTSADLINQTISTKQEIEKNKNDKFYQKPKLIYGLPKTPCGKSVIESDKRTFSEKNQEAKELEFRRIFGESAPKQMILKFKVVGIGPDPADFLSSPSVSGILQSFLSSNLGQASWLTPIEARDGQPLLNKLFPKQPTDISQLLTHYVELPDADSAKTFLDNENCEPAFPEFSGPSSVSDGGKIDNPYVACDEAGKYFSVHPFGSSSIALQDAKKSFAKIFKIAAIIITILASIIMIGTVGRVVADSRRETAVFRAIGAKRLDIAQIYFTYTVFLAGLVTATALIIGFVVASLAQARWSDGLTVDALVAYNSQDLSRHFNLYGLNGGQLIFIIVLIVLAGLASAILPVLSNIRRNPINDMRDEN